jgi:hypothetical protein
MEKGQPTARTRAWQIRRSDKQKSDDFLPQLIESHPSDRAFSTRAVWVAAQSENSKAVSFLCSALTWLKDCYDCHQEGRKEREALNQQMDEFDALNIELTLLRDRFALFQQQQSLHSHCNFHEVTFKEDCDLEHYRLVIRSLQAQVESLLHIGSKLSNRD